MTDHISDLLFTTEPSGTRNLLNEGLPEGSIHFVGNTMIDTLREHLKTALQRKPWEQNGFQPGEYALATLHRPSNVDVKASLRDIISALEEIGSHYPILFPIHPRTHHRLRDAGIQMVNVRVIPPLGYLDFIGLMAKAKLVLTDSGGIQEETTALGVPCITIRENTERPVTIEEGTNRLAGVSREGILTAFKDMLVEKDDATVPKLWDGLASGRIMDVIENWLSQNRA